MRIITYQQKGSMAGKKEMEDRITACCNILSSGFHCMETEDGGVFGVFDGVGGLEGSAFASTFAAKTMAELEAPSAPDDLRNALEQIHESLVKGSKTATTATGVSVAGDAVCLFHIGNCRLYGLADGYIRQITTDQTRYEDLLNAGRLPEEIPESAKCVINACLGAREELIRKLVIRDISSRYSQCSRLLLTSDGVHDHVSVDDLESVLAGDLTKESLAGLAELAVRNGSEDDISIMVVEK